MNKPRKPLSEWTKEEKLAFLKRGKEIEEKFIQAKLLKEMKREQRGYPKDE